MRIFIDFDDVLFNTKQLTRDIINVFEKNGVSEEIFKKYYKDPTAEKKKNIVRKYSPYDQIKRIDKKEINTKGIKKELPKIIKDTRKYLFEDGVRFSKELKDEGLYIVSFGDGRFQKEKINNSGIAKYFKKIIIVDVSKAVAIRKILKNENIKNGEALIFIDDREKFLKDIKKSYPGMVTFLMKRIEGRYNDKRTNYCDFEVKNFDEILSIIRLR